MLFFTTYHHMKGVTAIIKRLTVIELRNENEPNVISYSKLNRKYIFKIFSNNSSLLVSHMLPKKEVHINVSRP